MKKLIILLLILLIPLLALAQTAEEYFDRGKAKYDLGDYRGAIQDYNKVMELNPNYAFAYLNRGVAKYALGDYKGAIQV
jgi:tetratricopeptide (TPR) repeat protein